MRCVKSSNSLQRLGTTKRGIGPAYEDKVGRRAIRVIDLKDLSTPAGEDRPSAGASQCAAPRIRFRGDRRRRRCWRHSRRSRRRSCPIIGSRWRELDAARRAGKRILFEGAQAVLLDIDHGTYPFVTSSNTVAGQAAAGSGIGPRADRLSCSASPKATRRASAKARSRPNKTTPSAKSLASVAMNSARSQDASGAAAGSTPFWSARQRSQAASTASR